MTMHEYITDRLPRGGGFSWGWADMPNLLRETIDKMRQNGDSALSPTLVRVYADEHDPDGHWHKALCLLADAMEAEDETRISPTGLERLAEQLR